MDPDDLIARVRELVAEGDRLGAAAALQRGVADAPDDATRIHLESYRHSFLLAVNDGRDADLDGVRAALASLDEPPALALDPHLRERLRLELRLSIAAIERDERAHDDLVVAATRLVVRQPRALTTAVRAVNNRLMLQLGRLEDEGIGPAQPGHVDAALAIGQARGLAAVLGERGRIDRRAVRAAVEMGEGERAWRWTLEALDGELSSSERVGLEGLGALIAWERGDAEAAVRLGTQARTRAQGRSTDWIRSLGALGGVVVAAHGIGSMPAALRAYRSSASREAHLRLRSRGHTVAVIALESGADRDEVEAMLVGCFGDRAGWEAPWRAFVDATAAPGTWPSDGVLDAWCDDSGPAWRRAAALRLRALGHLARGDRALAARDVARGLREAARWPGRRRAALERLQQQVRPDRMVTAAQEAVLALVVQGRTDREIAAQLGRSPRTVESHVRALLRAFGVPSRVALAVAASSDAMLGA
ncbi:helix-turn-helix transcriptional regulator [Agrococcus terreus]|uniref:LuxR C-terminal-related transcriptional regulator n=1 Tax=Agrococcus terreus TaxID=574649 RepID=UPI00384A68B2